MCSVVLAYAVRVDLVELAREVQGHPVGQVTAMGQVHPEDAIARLEHAEVRRHVGLRSGVRLDVDVFGAREEGEGAFLGEALGDVDELTATVVALAGQALGVLVREPRALGLHDRRERVVLARDQLDLVVLATQLALHRRPQVGIDLGDLRPPHARRFCRHPPTPPRALARSAYLPMPRPCPGQSSRWRSCVGERGRDRVPPDRPDAQDPRQRPRAVDDRRRGAAMRRAAIEHEIDRVSEALEDLGTVARLGFAGPVRGGRGQRTDLPCDGPRRGMVGHPEADRRCAVGQDGRECHVQAARSDDRQAARPERATQRLGRRAHRADPLGLCDVREQQRDRTVGRPLLHAEEPFDSLLGVEIDGDPVDRIGRDGDDPPGAQDANRLGTRLDAVRQRPRRHPSSCCRNDAARRASVAAFRRAASGRARTSASMSSAAPSASIGPGR